MAAKRQSPVPLFRTLADVETHNLSLSGKCWASYSLSFVSCSNCLVDTWRSTRTTSPCCVLFKSLLMMSHLDSGVGWQPSCCTIMHSSTCQVNSYPAPTLSLSLSLSLSHRCLLQMSPKLNCGHLTSALAWHLPSASRKFTGWPVLMLCCRKWCNMCGRRFGRNLLLLNSRSTWSGSSSRRLTELFCSQLTPSSQWGYITLYWCSHMKITQVRMPSRTLSVYGFSGQGWQKMLVSSWSDVPCADVVTATARKSFCPINCRSVGEGS